MEQHPIPPNINAAPRFVEPRVHPDIDSYIRNKLDRASREVVGKIREEKIKAVKAAGIKTYGGRQIIDDEWIKATTVNDEEISSPEILRLREMWKEASSGNFTSLNTELERDIADVTRRINEHLQSTNGNVRLDVEAYNRHQANIDEWQAIVKETPIDPNTRLFQQVQRTVIDLVARRDMTTTGTMYKQGLRPLQRVQGTISALQSSTGEHPVTGR